MAAVVFEDLSGAATPVSDSDNPHQPLIEAANNDPLQIQERYSTHRTTRNGNQKTKILDQSFAGWTLDPILAKLDGPNKDPAFIDERFCLVFWGRPPGHIRKMIYDIQQEIREIAPDMWFMPQENLHITVLELVHSTTEPEMNKLVSALLKDGAAERIANLTLQYRPRLIKPMVSYDAAAIALSFVPAAGEGEGNTAGDDKFTYQHLRRDVFDQAKAAGVTPASRYAVPSAHLTLGRFINQNGFQDGAGTFDNDKVKRVIDTIEGINARLEAQYWPSASGIPTGGEWTVGQEKGLDFRRGRLCRQPPRPARSCTPANTVKMWQQITAQLLTVLSILQVNVPKTRRTYCKGKECKKHTQHKVTQYKAGKASLFAQGKRRYDRKQSGYGGQTKPVFHKKAKTTKKVVLRLECTQCKTKAQLALKRCKHFELGGDKKTKGAALVF
ncbi:uncharacterized protein TRUGW13939_06193 [Talaromyces rugulosus]|uniref:60S ribosomal protein L44 n=1 Tax=Talaromyces rugulosus TaxID=121627 RepID=A0A7H8R2K3_TALRU|nr:uncharacterized protein TRUGW13939_06193 [Talaromyces rugulosus]QKX59063.1 hypothetical protein TRUGW13939_06193 [Talaromyces rugulosus]